MKKILLATGNRHKLREVRQILAPFDVRVLGPDQVGGLPEVEESGSTFRENALLKAAAAVRACGLPAMADDSGLEVEALGGRPGVFSSRYAGENADDEKNLRKLLRELNGEENRRARFVCALAIVFPDGRTYVFEGEVPGRIGTEPRGTSGFGYDPVFIPDGYDRTFGELGDAVKQRLSHRARALQKAVESGVFAEIEDAP